MVFAGAAAVFGAEEVDDGVARRGVQPVREDGTLRERRGVAGEGDENVLGDVGGAVRIAVEAAERGGVDEAEVACDEGGEGGSSRMSA